MSLEQLDKLGVDYHRTTKWVGEPRTPSRKCVELDEVKSVQLPLTPEEWCCMCMREGDDYMGSCCGNMGVMQDILNSVFRDSGWTDASSFRRIADACINHDGFDEFSDEKMLEDALEKGLKNRRPWEKVGIVWQAVQDVLIVENKELPSQEDLNSLDGAIRIASKHIALVRWKNFWNKDPNDGGQSNCLYKMDLATLLSALRTIYDKLEEQKLDTIEGFGIRNKDSNVGMNYFRAFVFEDEAKAKEVLKVLEKNENFDKNVWDIVPFRVTVGRGLEWMEKK